MRKQFLIAASLISIFAYGEIRNIHQSQSLTKNPNLKIITYKEFKSLINKTDNTLYVINFWATWCKPCVEELPEFMEVNANYKKNPRFKMILISLDLAKELESNVKPFLLKKNIDTDTYIMNDIKRMNEWIPDIDTNWTGAIPATVLYRNGKKVYFHEGELTKNELIKIINNNLK